MKKLHAYDGGQVMCTCGKKALCDKKRTYLNLKLQSLFLSEMHSKHKH